jgi:hypothetical protein
MRQNIAGRPIRPSCFPEGKKIPVHAVFGKLAINAAFVSLIVDRPRSSDDSQRVQSALKITVSAPIAYSDDPVGPIAVLQC